MTLILGARCINGVTLAADRKFSGIGTRGVQYSFGNKITGELNGILTAFAGDVGTFQLFAMNIREYIDSTIKIQFQKKEKETGPSLDQLMLKVSEIQSRFYNKYRNYPCKIFMGISSQHLTNKMSSLYHFEADGRCFPLTQPRVIGSGSSYAIYFLKRYWQPNQTTMEQFAQLSDFIIRYISSSAYLLDNAVGLDDNDTQYRYPQIAYIPDNPSENCSLDEARNQRLDCQPTMDELEGFKLNSENILDTLYKIKIP